MQYTIQVYQLNHDQREDVDDEDQALSLPQACHATLNGKTVHMLLSALSAMFGIDPSPYCVMHSHYITIPLSREEAAFP